MTQRIAIAMAVLAAVIVIALGVPLVMVFKDSGTRSLRLGLERDALVLASDLSAVDLNEWTQRARAYQADTGADVAVVDTADRLVFDSEGTAAGNVFDPPELRAALTGRIVSGVRRAPNADAPLNYAAVPVTHGRETVGALRLSVPASTVQATVTKIEWLLVAALGLVLGMTTALAWLLARVLTRPLRQLAKVAREIGADPHTQVTPVSGPAEVREVSEALSDTGAELALAIDRSKSVAEEASHHLRTPLAALRLRVEALSDVTEGRTHADAEAALVEVDRLARRIDQILAMAAESSASEERIEVADVVERRIGYWRGFAEEQGKVILADLQPAVIRHQRGAVERTLDELIGNALAYARITVRVTLGTDGDTAFLRVGDDGPGIPDQDRDRVFERFRRGSTARPGGSGLGLTLVRDSARLIGGDAVVLEGAGGGEGGAVVEVRWPSVADGDVLPVRRFAVRGESLG